MTGDTYMQEHVQRYRLDRLALTCEIWQWAVGAVERQPLPVKLVADTFDADAEVTLHQLREAFVTLASGSAEAEKALKHPLFNLPVCVC